MKKWSHHRLLANRDRKQNNLVEIITDCFPSVHTPKRISRPTWIIHQVRTQTSKQSGKCNDAPQAYPFLSTSCFSHYSRSPNGNDQNWQSVADRINELERQNQNQNIINKNTNNQKYTYLDPAKTTRVPNMTLKAFQKNAVQSYFERQQQQQQQVSPTKETAVSPKMTKLQPLNGTNGSNGSTNGMNGSNGNLGYDNNNIYTAISNGSALSTNGSSPMRPQSMPVNKVSVSTEALPQSRLSLPNKLSQIINLTTQLSAQKQTNGKVHFDKQIITPALSAVVKSPAKQRASIVMVDKNNLQSINESGVPPPPPRRSNRSVMPVRR